MTSARCLRRAHAPNQPIVCVILVCLYEEEILVTNDDGVRSEGIKALAAALAPLGEVITVAPVLEASASGHALTLRRPLRIEKLSEQVFSVDGTPTDCVNIAIHKVLAGLPDLVVSGINKGCNLGDDVTYSGTVAGALEGMLLGVPSIAISHSVPGTGSSSLRRRPRRRSWLGPCCSAGSRPGRC